MRKCLYEKITLAGNFNAQEGEQLLHTFLYQHELHSINKNPMCRGEFTAVITRLMSKCP